MKAIAHVVAFLLVWLVSPAAHAVTTTVTGTWPSGQTQTLTTNITGPANAQQTSFTGTTGPWNYVLYPFQVTQTGSYTATSTTTNVTNTTWFLNGTFTPSNTTLITPLSNFIVAVLATGAAPGSGTFAARTYTAGQQYSVLVAFNTGSTSGDLSTLTITGPGCVVISTNTCTPTEPQSPSAVAGPAQATVTFSAPLTDGGSPITGYTVVSDPAGGVDSNAGSTSTSHLITGLTNGTAYTFTVVATNATGSGPASVPSNSVTPLDAPGAPTIGVVTPGNGQVSVAFTAPASDGGSPITSYTATCGTQSASGAGSPISVTGLANGIAVDCSVVAINAVGTSPPSATVSVTPVTVPDAPVIVSVVGGNGQITVNFTAPASDGGAAITSYTATCSANGQVSRSASGTGSPITVSGLVGGAVYTCSVIATNAGGSSSASPGSIPVTIATSQPLVIPANSPWSLLGLLGLLGLGGVIAVRSRGG